MKPGQYLDLILTVVIATVVMISPLLPENIKPSYKEGMLKEGAWIFIANQPAKAFQLMSYKPKKITGDPLKDSQIDIYRRQCATKVKGNQQQMIISWETPSTHPSHTTCSNLEDLPDVISIAKKLGPLPYLEALE